MEVGFFWLDILWFLLLSFSMLTFKFLLVLPAAGKTTTINMLTGMAKPTSGYALVNGEDIRTQMNQIRQETGICLQHDCLFPQLTVKEHIQFFARIKGLYAKMSRNEADESVMTSIEDVALLEKRNSLSKNLSGGMKRKLSVAIAFCGDSKTVLLDEPTSGMVRFSSSISVHDCTHILCLTDSSFSSSIACRTPSPVASLGT